MSQGLTQNVADELILVLSKDSVAVSGLVFTDVAVELRKEGEAGFTAKVLTAPDFVDLGDGVYGLQLADTELDTAGKLTVKTTGGLIDQNVVIAEVFTEGSVGTAVSLETCVVTGHVFDASGNPKANAAVTARVLGRPSIEQYQVALTDDDMSTTTDASGEFFLTLVRLADVEIFIPVANYRRRLVVPNLASANLFTEIP